MIKGSIHNEIGGGTGSSLQSTGFERDVNKRHTLEMGAVIDKLQHRNLSCTFKTGMKEGKAREP